MATHRIPLLSAHIVPDSGSGNAFFAPYKTINVGSLRDANVLILNASVVGLIHGAITLPENYVSTPVLEIVWTSETTTGDVDFNIDHRSVPASDTNLLDTETSPANRTDTSVNNTGPSVASERMVTTFSLTSTDMGAGETWQFEFSRDGVTDTKADAITIWGLNLKYDDA